MTTEVESVAAIKTELLKTVKPINGRPDYLSLHELRRGLAKGLKQYKHPNHPKTGHAGLPLTEDQARLLLGHRYVRVTPVQEECPALTQQPNILKYVLKNVDVTPYSRTFFRIEDFYPFRNGLQGFYTSQITFRAFKVTPQLSEHILDNRLIG